MLCARTWVVRHCGCTGVNVLGGALAVTVLLQHQARAIRYVLESIGAQFDAAIPTTDNDANICAFFELQQVQQPPSSSTAS